MLKEQIFNDLKQALREKNEKSLSVLRMLNGAIRNKEISLRSSEGDISLNDEQVVDVIKSEIKKRNDAITSYLSGGRNDLADKENEEIKILEKYLPPQLSDEEIEKEVKDIINSIGQNINFGIIMGQVMSKLKGRVDGNKVSEIVKKILNF